MALLRTAFWGAVFVASTFAFTVIFEHGTTNFVKNAKKEYETLRAMVDAKPVRKKDESDKLAQPVK